MSVAYSFLPWTRQGAASMIQTPDDIDGNQPPGNGPGSYAETDVSLHLNRGAPVPMTFRLYGPGEVVGVDARQVIRTEPTNRTPDFESNYFPALEFDRPDFPWLFTPAKANGDGQLRPWVCLVVVRKRDGVTLTADRTRPLPVLTLGSPITPAEELPDLRESWAWAHTQVLQDESGTDLKTLLSSPSTRTISRLICPRQLAPSTTYLACLVPAFKAGVQAGLGHPIPSDEADTLLPAWDLSLSPQTIELPVYYHWEFSTGEGGDFEALASRLQPIELPSEVGQRRLHVGSLGLSGAPDVAPVAFAGVFRPPDMSSDAPLHLAPLRQPLRDLLNASENRLTGVTPRVGPPLYGRWHLSQYTVPEDSSSHNWLRDLNLDPRHRAAAGLGVLFVQSHQDQLMVSAWQQLGEIERGQQLMQQGELAQEVSHATFEKHLRLLDAETFAQVTSPVAARVQTDSQQTLAAQVREVLLPETSMAAFRRTARPRGPIGRRMLSSQEPAVPSIPVSRGELREATPDSLADSMSRPLVVATTHSDTQSGLNALTEHFLSARSELLDYIESLKGLAATPNKSDISLNSADIQSMLLPKLDPKVSVTRRIQSQLHLALTNGVKSADEPGDGVVFPRVLPYPKFPQPMFDALRKFAPDFLVSGMEHLPNNSVTLMETNPEFITAFMLGLNHEMSRELLWREYPTDQRGTYFRHFWGAGMDTNGDYEGDLPEIQNWALDTPLNQILLRGQAAGQLVMLIRGDLLRRYPDTVIYAVEADETEGLSSAELYPIFQTALGSDLTAVICDLTRETALGTNGGPGYLFVFQQQPTGPRFGLDATSDVAIENMSAWSELAWDHVALDASGHLHIASSGTNHNNALNNLNDAERPGDWGKNAAHMASITLQSPFRIAIHAEELL